MTERFFIENPNSKLAADLYHALKNNQPFQLPLLKSKSLEFFEESSDLKKLCRLAEPFLTQPKEDLPQPRKHKF